MIGYKGRVIMCLGGTGLVGRHIVNKLIQHEPKHIHVTGFTEEEFEGLQRLFKTSGRTIRKKSHLKWKIDGVLITGQALDVLPKGTNIYSSDYEGSELYKTILKLKPCVIFDSITSATIAAYENIPEQSSMISKELEKSDSDIDLRKLRDLVTNFINKVPSQRLAWLFRCLDTAIRRAKSSTYVKIGTTGTGGMGMNIPYSHGEGGKRPSDQLLSKTAMAFAETGMRFISSRTVGYRVIEIKPGAAIGWNEINYGKIRYLRKPDLKEIKDKNIHVFRKKKIRFDNISSEYIDWQKIDELEGPFITTGENGQFTIHEFNALTRIDQMGLVMASEVASYAIEEAAGKSTGKDVINMLQSGVVPPTCKGALMREYAMRELRQLELSQPLTAPVYLNLGPPRLSKLITEAELIRKSGVKYIEELASLTPEELLSKVTTFVEKESSSRYISRIISLGVPILMPDMSMYAGPFIANSGVKIGRENDLYKDIQMNLNQGETFEDSLNKRAALGWVDLRDDIVKVKHGHVYIFTGLATWIERAKKIIRIMTTKKDKESLRRGDLYYFTENFTPEGILIDAGAMAGWLLANEDKGRRWKY